MRMERVTRWIAAAVLAALAIALAACAGSSSDKVGGTDTAKPRVLTMATAIGVLPQLAAFAEEVSRLSDGTLEIQFKENWRAGDPRNEAGALADVEDGKIDMTWVGARAFDTVGVTSFQALVAPLLIDSYELESKVFEQGIPERMLEGVDQLDLVGIGVLPGPMRKLLGVSKPFLRPGDFAGQVVGLQDSAVADMTLRALGATPRPVPAQASLEGLNAYEQQLESIAGNLYDRDAEYVTANVNLWPRALVIAMGEAAFESLTTEQQTALREAADAAVPEALAASRAEDEDAASVLCRRGMTFAVASGSDLAALRTALEPVYAKLTADPKTKSQIDAITSLKTEVAASAEATACNSNEPPPVASAIPDGSYQTTLTKADWLKRGSSEEEASQSAGVYTMIFDAGELTILSPNGEPGFVASYTIFRDQIEAQENAEYMIIARWSLEGKTLEFTDIRVPGDPEAIPETVTWASHPWVKVEAGPTPVDGVYEFTTTAEELLAAGSGDAVVENYGRFRWVLDGGHFEMTQKNGASDRWTKGTYVVRNDIVEFTVEEFGGVAPNNAHEKTGEVFTYTWSLYRDQLTLGAVEGAVSPENFLAKPWTRVD